MLCTPGQAECVAVVSVTCWLKHKSDHQKASDAVPGHTDHSCVPHNLTGGDCISLGIFFVMRLKNSYFNFFSGLSNKEGSSMEITYL